MWLTMAVVITQSELDKAASQSSSVVGKEGSSSAQVAGDISTVLDPIYTMVMCV